MIDIMLNDETTTTHQDMMRAIEREEEELAREIARNNQERDSADGE